MDKGKGLGKRRLNINFRQTRRSRTATNSNVSFGRYQRMEPYKKRP